ncbi:MAG: hypothetical protein ACK6DQ_18645, partial [Planctomycetota bacterium]
RSLRSSKPQRRIRAIYPTIRIGKRASCEPELLFPAYLKIYGGFNRQDLSQDPLRYVVVTRWIVTVVSSAGIFRKIHYGTTSFPDGSLRWSHALGSFARSTTVGLTCPNGASWDSPGQSVAPALGA